MAVNRKLLQQALKEAQGTQQRAVSGQGFDPRGGIGVAALQIATAGVGAFKASKAKQALLEQDKQEQQAFQQNFPSFEGQNLSKETREAISLQSALARIKAQNQQPSFSTRDTAQGVVRINEATGEVVPLQTQEGEAVQPFRKQGTVVNVGAGETAFEKETGRKKAERFSNIIDAGDRAFTFDSSLNEIESALDEGAFIGPGATKVATVNELLSAAGLPADLEKAANTRVIEQRLGDLTLQATGKLKGAISEKELALAQKTIFDIGTSEVATRKGIATLKRLNSYDQGLADLASGLEQEGKFTRDFRETRKAFNRDFRKDLNDLLNQSTDEFAPQQPQVQQGAVQEGQTATNPQTGETLTFRGGQWQ